MKGSQSHDAGSQHAPLSVLTLVIEADFFIASYGYFTVPKKHLQHCNYTGFIKGLSSYIGHKPSSI